MYQKALLIDQCTFKGLSTLTDPQKDLIDALGLDTLIFEKVKDLYPDIYKDLLNKQLPKTDALNDTYIVTDFCNNAGHIKKAFVIEFIEHCKAREINVDYVNPENPTDNHTDVKYYIPHIQKPTITLGNPFPDTEYKAYIEAITLKDPNHTEREKSFGERFWDTTVTSAFKAYKDFKEPMEDLYAWNRKTNNGTILLSSSEGYTTELQKLSSSSAAPFKTRHSEVGQYDEDLKSEIDVFKNLS